MTSLKPFFIGVNDSAKFWICIVNDDTVRYWIYLIPNVSDTERIRYRTYQIPNVSDTERIKYRTNQIPNLSGTQTVRFPTCQVSHLSDTQPVRYPTCQIPNLLDTEPIRYRTWQHHQPLLMRTVGKSELRLVNFSQLPLSLPAHTDLHLFQFSLWRNQGWNRSIPAPSPPPSSQWPPTPPSMQRGKIGEKTGPPQPPSPPPRSQWLPTPSSAHCGEIEDETGPSQPPLPLPARNDRQPFLACTVANWGWNRSIPAPSPAPSSQWPPTPPSSQCGEIGDETGPSQFPSQLTMTANPSQCSPEFSI